MFIARNAFVPLRTGQGGRRPRSSNVCYPLKGLIEQAGPDLRTGKRIITLFCRSCWLTALTSPNLSSILPYSIIPLAVNIYADPMSPILLCLGVHYGLSQHLKPVRPWSGLEDPSSCVSVTSHKGSDKPPQLL